MYCVFQILKLLIIPVMAIAALKKKIDQIKINVQSIINKILQKFTLFIANKDIKKS